LSSDPLANLRQNSNQVKQNNSQTKADPLAQFRPQPTKKEDAPKVSSLSLARKQLNSSDMTSGVSPKPGFWEKVRNLDLEDTKPFKAIKAVGDIPYKIPLTQRFFTTLGNTIGGEGTVKADDGSAMQKMDAGKVGNLVAAISATGVAYGMKLPGMSSSVQGGIDRVLNPLEANVLSKLPNMSKAGFKAIGYGTNALKSGIDMSAGNVIQGVAQGQNKEEILKGGIDGLWQGAAFGTALKGAGDITKSAFPGWKTTLEDVKPLEESRPIKEVKPITPIKGTFKVKDTALEQAQKNYDEAIKVIQNHFRTDKLTPGEIARIKPELGIDLERLIKDLETADTDVRAIGEAQRLATVAGVNDAPSKLQNPFEPKLEAPKPLETAKVEAAATTQKPSLGATDRLHSLTQIVSSDEGKSKKALGGLWNKFYTRFVDSVHATKKVGDKTHMLATNSKNAGGIVDTILTENLVNRQGEKIGEGLKNIVKDIPEDKQDDFLNYVLQRHNIDRAREGKPVYSDFTPEESLKAVQLIENLHPEYKTLNDRLIKFVRDFEEEWANNSGLLSDELWESLQDTYKNYVPTQRNFDELEKGFSNANGRGFVDQGNTLKKATGSDRDIVNPLENIMQLVNKTVRTAKYNEVGQSMLEELRKSPGELKHLAEIIPDTEIINPKVNNVVTVLEGGKPVNVRVNNRELLEALQGITKANTGDIEAAVKKGTNVFKSLITTKNPVFAVRNIARDIPSAYINGSESNPVKFAKDLIKAGKDIVTNSENFQQYKGVGGGGSNFFKGDNTAKNVKELTNKSLLKKVGESIETFNNIIESAPRLAEFNRILDKTGDIQKALFAANDVTTNFSRGGDISKHIDSFVPYFNAGVQGLDKLARQFKDKPIPTAAKGLIGITTMSIALDVINKDNPNYQQLDNRTKDTYFLIPKEDGTFIKIPKTREYGVLFSDLFERTLRTARGEKQAYKGFFKSGDDLLSFTKGTVATSFSPTNPFESNIFSPVLNLKGNKDFANRDIVPRAMVEDGRSKYLQYDEKTSEVTKAIASLAKKGGIELSPKQMDYLIRSYTGVIGQIGLPATTKATMTGTTAGKLLKPVTTQFIADPLYSNQTITDFYDNFDKIKSKASDKNILEKVPSKVKTKEEAIKSTFTKASKDMSDLNKKIKEAEAKNNLEEVKRLRAKIIEIALKTNKTYDSKLKP
jgi:hypothetical protein